ncbi:RDH13 isoform 16 [Pan troglodytes]|uniref:Retinol dehydrogenase 13 n=3 Tax=Hominidae TaxID=9604 RepID=K7ERV1_HUMAN|nr:RDH13 isoform 16 [Pan troglodytes]PNJ01878.1 RDH13 isoform 2 [Pongo abelii]PNJ01884.1 RDH13 isoform 10 [Pongo abelii]
MSRYLLPLSALGTVAGAAVLLKRQHHPGLPRHGEV